MTTTSDNTPVPSPEPVIDRAIPPARVLMCAPTSYDVRYVINPWMSLQNNPDIPRARRQWDSLYRTLAEDIGATVELIPQASDCPDMVFTANAGVVRGKSALLARFRHPQRQPEEARFQAWFEEHGYRVETPPAGCNFEGEGDALFVGDTLVAGYLKRSDITAHRWLSEQLFVPVLSVQLADDRWYHLDTCLFALDSRTIAYFPAAFDEYARRVLDSNFDTVIVSEEEALRFACNAVVLGRHVVLNTGCPKLEQDLAALGYEPQATELGEFIKAGGSAKCLTLRLDGEDAAMW